MKAFDFIKNKIKLNKASRKRLLLKQASLLCVTVLMLICFSWAWFISRDTVATASGISVTMDAGDSLLISLDGGQNFTSGIDLLSAGDQDIIGEANKIRNEEGILLSMDDITSDGKKFYRPVFDEENGKRTPNTSENWDDASKNRSYMTQTIVFRTNKKSDIFMGPGTKIITSCENDEKRLVSDNPADIGNKNKSYNFSNDCIVGALRMSAVDNSGNICFVCIPRSDVELVRNGSEITMNTGDSVSADAKIHYYYSTNYQVDKAPVAADASDVIFGFDGTQKIATTTYNESTGFYEATATVNIWLEGCDPETTRVLSGGKFQIAFDFVGRDNNESD